MIAGYSPQELARAEIAEMDAANEFLKDFWARFNAAFAVEPKEPKNAFSPAVPSMKAKLTDILCLKEERTVGNDNSVSYHGRRLKIPPPPGRTGVATMCGPRCGSTGPRTARWRSSTAPGDWRATTPTVGCWIGLGRRHERFRLPLPLASAGGGTEKRTLHLLPTAD